MSCYLQHQNAIDPENMQVWNNAVFDKASPISGGRRLRSVSCSEKENRSPVLPIKETPKSQRVSAKPAMKVHFMIKDEDRTIDLEIEAIEKEIKILSTRLEDLRLEKEERNLKVTMDARRGKIVAARFMDSSNNSSSHSMAMMPTTKKNKKIEEITPAREKFRRRGLSLGPLEITPVKITVNTRRMSCFPTENKISTSRKLQSMSVSPKSRRNPIPKFSELRKGVESFGGGGSKKAVRNHSGTPMTLQPKSLFQNELTKKPLAATTTKRSLKGRPVPSRYGTATTTTQTPERKRRKWSMPDRPIVISASETSEESPEETKYLPPPLVSLPKIRTDGGGAAFKSPRDSGAVKRAGEVIGRRSHFGGIMESTCCQNLSFEEELELHPSSSSS